MITIIFPLKSNSCNTKLTFFLLRIFFVIVYEYVCVYVCECTWKHVCVCRPEVHVAVFFDHSLFYILRQDLFLNLELTNSTRLLSRQPLGTHFYEA